MGRKESNETNKTGPKAAAKLTCLNIVYTLEVTLAYFESNYYSFY